MASREVNHEDVPKPAGKFLKTKEVFQKIGDVFTGEFVRVSDEPKPQYGYTYTFKVNGDEKDWDLKGLLHEMLKKANLSQGEIVRIKWVGNEDTGKDNPMRLFKLKVETPTEEAPF